MEDPSYQGFDQQFWSTRSNRQIQLVSTDISDLEDLSGLHSSDNSLLNRGHLDSSLASQSDHLGEQEVIASTMSARDAAEANIRSLDSRARDMCDDLEPDQITVNSAQFMKDELKEISDVRDAYREAVRKFLSDFVSELIEAEVTQWKADMKSVVDIVKQHKLTVLDKVGQLQPAAATMTEYEKASIKIQEKTYALKQQESDKSRNEALAVAKPLIKLVEEKCSELDDELAQITVMQLETGDEQQVTRTMQKLAGWKLQVEAITSLYQEFLTRTALHPIDPGDQIKVSAAVQRTKSALSDIIAAAEDEDMKRQLYSLDTTNRGEQVKWPEFAGEVGEYFFKVKKDFINAAKQNRTSTKNQITKLRENINGYAKSLIPASIEDINKGLEILENACGDTMRVVNHRAKLWL